MIDKNGEKTKSSSIVSKPKHSSLFLYVSDLFVPRNWLKLRLLFASYLFFLHQKSDALSLCVHAKKVNLYVPKKFGNYFVVFEVRVRLIVEKIVLLTLSGRGVRIDIKLPLWKNENNICLRIRCRWIFFFMFAFSPPKLRVDSPIPAILSSVLTP